MPLEIVQGDITKIKADAIVNAANTSLAMGGGVCGAIFAAAGAQKLQSECSRIGHCDTGEAVITGAYGLRAEYIIHTPGPIWHGGGNGEEGLLKYCYINSLRLAEQYGCASVAFALVSSGIYGVPTQIALRTAVCAINGFLQNHNMTVYLVVFDKDIFALCESLRG